MHPHPNNKIACIRDKDNRVNFHASLPKLRRILMKKINCRNYYSTIMKVPICNKAIWLVLLYKV